MSSFTETLNKSVVHELDPNKKYLVVLTGNDLNEEELDQFVRQLRQFGVKGVVCCGADIKVGLLDDLVAAAQIIREANDLPEFGSDEDLDDLADRLEAIAAK